MQRLRMTKSHLALPQSMPKLVSNWKKNAGAGVVVVATVTVAIVRAMKSSRVAMKAKKPTTQRQPAATMPSKFLCR
jgi:hypothetical protein